MTTTQYPSVVVALFASEHQARQAIHALLQAGFTRDQIHFAGHGTAPDLLASIKGLFQAGATSAASAYDDLIAEGMPDHVARYYQQEYEAGRSIVEVTGVSGLQEARTILGTYGGYGAPPGGVTAGTAAEEGEQRLSLHEEQLQIYKRPVQTGTVGLRKEVVSEQKTVDVPVTREDVYIERRPGSGEPSATPIGEGETYRVPVYEEQVSVKKQPVEKEEVVLGKQQVEETRRISETVRREEARVEHEGDITWRNQEKDQQQ
ncbi:MAG TPA: YsnF/AvaK domain-containing protein [Ktedonobacteraceae bacterium]|jgi:uncharacterized protein (TIGR02271 family)